VSSVGIMFSSQHDALCSQLKGALVAAKSAVDGNAVQVGDLSEQLIVYAKNLAYTMKTSQKRDLAFTDSILKHDLIPLHMEYIARGMKTGMPLRPGSPDLQYFDHLPSYFANALGDPSYASKCALKACLLKHDYVSFLMSTYQVLIQKSGRKRMDLHWQASSVICHLVACVLLVEDTEHLQDQEQISSKKSASSKNRHGLKSDHPALRSRKLEEFLLRHLSVWLRQVQPPDLRPPGALASFSLESEGMVLECDLSPGSMLSVYYYLSGTANTVP
jgi:hypothetical protein